MDSVKEIEQALNSLYGNTDPNLKNKANQFLLEFQRSTQSWDLIFPILENKSSSFELKLFICQTLRSKIQYDYSQLNEINNNNNNNSIFESLRLSILKNLLNLSNFKTDKLLVIQLSIALAYLTIQDFNWQNPIIDIMNYLSNNPINLLEFLKILPEELSDSKKLPLTNEEFEIQYKKLILNNIENIYYILIESSNSLLINNNKDLEILILNCIKSWINELPINLILNNNSQLWNLINLGFKNDETFDTSIDCLITIINQIDIFDKLNENLQFIELIYKQLISLKPLLEENWDDPLIIERFTELYSITGEAWHTLIVKNPENFQNLIEIILQLTNYNEDLDIVKYTFKFWYELKSMLLLDKFKNSKILFKPIYIKLIEILINHLKYPTISNSTSINELFNNNKENEDKFKDFRYEIGDVLKDCCLIVGQYDSLKLPFDKLKILIENKSNLSIKWQDIECLLFSIRAMAKEIDKNENKILPQIMNYLVQLPENPKIRYAATLVLGRYTIWTNEHPDFLQIELNYIIEGFKLENFNYNNDEKLQIIIAASHALKYFCMDCNNLLINYLEPLFNLYSNVENFLDFQSLYDIVEGLSFVLKKFIEKNLINNEIECLNIIKMFWNSTIEKLNNFNNLNLKNLNNLQDIDSIDIKIANTIELLTLYIDNFKPPNEFIKLKNPNFIISNFIMNEILPLIFSIIEKFGKSSKVSERCIKFIRRCIQNFKRFLIPSLKSIENLLLEGFKNFKFGCYLWCSGTLIKEFSNEENENDDIDEFIKLDNNTLNDVWNFSLEQIKNFIDIYNNSINDINDDIIEDFFRMMNDILMFKPLELLNNFEIVELIYNLSINIIDKFNEYDILNKVINFLTDLLSWSLENPPISIYYDIPNVLKFKVYGLIKNNNNNNNNNIQLVSKFLNYSIFKFNDDLIYDSIELVIETFKINNCYNNQFDNLSSINEFLSSLPQDIITDNEKLKFYSNMEISLNSKNFRKIRSTLLDFIHWYKRKIINRN